MSSNKIRGKHKRENQHDSKRNKSNSYQPSNIKKDKQPTNDKKMGSQSIKDKSKNKHKPIVKINRDVIENRDRLEQEYWKKRKEEEMMEQETEKLEINKEEKKQEIEEQKTEAVDSEVEAKIKKKMQAENRETVLVNRSDANEESNNVDTNKKVDNETIKKTSVENGGDEKKQADEATKKDKRPSRIDMKDKSEQFKKIIDIALAYEKLDGEKNKLKEKNKVLCEANNELKEVNESLKGNLEATELLCKKKQEEIDELKSDVAHRNEVIDIVKADKSESEQEFKNALAASLKTYLQDYKELKALDMSDDVGYAIIETLEGVFKVLDKNGIHIQ